MNNNGLHPLIARAIRAHGRAAADGGFDVDVCPHVGAARCVWLAAYHAELLAAAMG